MTITDRRQRQKDEVRASILETAWAIIVTEGWPSFSIRKVADAIEYSVPVIYSHFENKDDILLEFSKKGFKLLADTLAAAKLGKEQPAEQIRAMGRAYWAFAFSNKEYYQLMFGLGIPTCNTAGRIPALADLNRVIMESLLAMAGPGNKPVFDPWLKYQSFWSMLHGLVSINLVSPERAVQPGGSGRHADHAALPQKVLDDVLCSFIRGIEAA